MNHILKNKPLIIAGPCALESKEQLRRCTSTLKKLGIKCIRASLWKPRTRPGWEGLGALGLHILLEETLPHGLIPATEILTSDHARLIVESICTYDKNAQILVWIGSRNQNHIQQQEIARILASGPKGIVLMAKNQMWECRRHWIGISEHILSTGFPKERLILCHRGFCPGKMPNPKSLRNLPDYEMSMQVKAITGSPIVFDPSHIGGSRERVLHIIEEVCKYDFDGLLVEVHSDPESATTDSSQQLSLQQFSKIIDLINHKIAKGEKQCVV